MKKILFFALILSLPIILIIHSCVKDEYDLDMLAEQEWKPEIAIPLIHASLSLRDILDDYDNEELIVVDHNTGFLAIVYKGTILSKKARELPFFPPDSSVIHGYAGQYTDTLTVDSVDLNLEIYNKVLSGSFYFEDPKLTVTFVNSYGVPINPVFTTFEAWSSINGKMQIELDGNTVPIPIALSPPPTVEGQSTTTIYEYDKNNSNIEDVLMILPRYIYYAVIATINDPPMLPNFMTDSSVLSVEVEIELPLYGYSNKFVLQDTLPFDFGIEVPEMVESAIFNVNVYNGFPVDVIMQLYFMDSTLTILDSLIYEDDKQIMSSGVIGPAPALKVIQSTHRLTTITVDDKSRIDDIAEASQMIFKAELTTPGAPHSNVKFYADYDLEVKLAVRAKLKNISFD
ncbi:MAG: hypothetical protein ABII90_05865 [Bacteroidota bacterium]